MGHPVMILALAASVATDLLQDLLEIGLLLTDCKILWYVSFIDPGAADAYRNDNLAPYADRKSGPVSCLTTI
jgi:hypothetical protein